MRVKFRPGGVLRVPLDENLGHSYARMLSDPPYVSFYGRPTHSERVDLERVVRWGPLFILAVEYEGAIAEFGWSLVGEISLESFPERIPLSFVQHPTIHADLVVMEYWGAMRPASFEECVELERAVVWQPDEVAQRLADHHAGRENQRSQELRAKYS